MLQVIHIRWADDFFNTLLENLFVPLHIDVTTPKRHKGAERQPVGQVIGNHRLALLAPPGGGKSTLLKRLAIAYVDPARRNLVDDELPNREWVPLFFRCRELRDLARRSFGELLHAISQREPVRQHASAFRDYVDNALAEGRVLLLVDGLDEISDPGDRAAFVCTLRMVLQAYPETAFIVTSREAGFRHVASHLAPVCTQTTLSPFNEEDIRRLSVAWHCEVIGDTEKVRKDAEELAETIASNDRIQQLAINPLLLTTLLLVRRWVGSLPTRRAVLYGKAVEVLLMTWNTEGHAPIPQEEALPQLCYVAAAMMMSGSQTISRPALSRLLQEAREALPTELGYVEGTVEEFIRRVEDRSSLLMMTGLDVEAGRLVEFFEFRHLTFQEYLTALGLVEGWHPGRNDSDTLASVLSPHANNPKWGEVIPLAAVLGGKQTEALIRALTEEVTKQDVDNYPSKDAGFALASCLTDEAAVRPDTIRSAVAALISSGFFESSDSRLLAHSRYGNDLRMEAQRAFLSLDVNLSYSGGALADTVWWQTLRAKEFDYIGVVNDFLSMMKSADRLSRCEGALGCMYICYMLRRPGTVSNNASLKPLTEAGLLLAKMVASDDSKQQFSAAWALAWLGSLRIWTPPAERTVVPRLFTLWRHSPDSDIRLKAGWALASQPVYKCQVNLENPMTAEEIREVIHNPASLREPVAALVVAWYTRALSNQEIARGIASARRGGNRVPPDVSVTLNELERNLPHVSREQPD